ncbi:glycine zipper domain-containing protein [Dyella sp. 20L07]|uniref:glycine zipper domain-containing protein n=1 Tax=Dyella sp. 20L07 TaxID=3384240 RepID=UPI003D2B286F
MHAIHRTTLSILCVAASTLCLAQQPPAYPAKGQAPQLQASDTQACRGWAQSTTGIDPNLAAQPAPQQAGAAVGGGQRVGGAVRGAAAGAMIGGVANDNAGHGAAVGAAAGVVAGGVRARQQRREQNVAAQEQQSGSLATFNQAYAACMKGRGYTLSQ